MRFKGRNAIAEADAFAKELHGRCTRVSDTELLLTRGTRLAPVADRAFVPPHLAPADYLNGNGRHDASRSGMMLGRMSL